MIWFWLGFLLLIGACLAIDLGLFNRKERVISIRKALTWTCVWIGVSFAFSAFIYFAYERHWFGIGIAEGNDPLERTLNGHEAAKLYIAGYMLEWMLSVDNLFVIAVILGYFRVPPQHQHRVLVWGILAAIVLRGVFIVSGTLVLEKLHFLIYVLAVGLLVIAYKMLRGGDDFDPSKHWVTRIVYKLFRVTPEIRGSHFVVKAPHPETRHDTYWLTPLAAALVVVNVVDLIFAIDSIPAVFGLTRETFIVFTSNIFAVLGLRSMYFALSAVLGKFHYLKYALAIILGMIGVKMLADSAIETYLPWVHEHSVTLTLVFIVIALTIGVIASLVYAKRHPEETQSPENALEAEALPEVRIDAGR